MGKYTKERRHKVIYCYKHKQKKKSRRNIKKARNKIYFFAKKPLKTGLIKAKKRLQENPENIAVVGDQLFTDVLGGNRCKMFTILIDPIAERDIWITRLKRPIENLLKEKYFKKINKGGVMDKK